MIKHLDTLRGRAFVLIFGLLIASNAAALWLYASRHDEAMNALHDVMVAEQAAIVIQFMDRLPATQRRHVSDALSGALIRVILDGSRDEDLGVIIEPRSKRISEVINAMLERTQHDRIRVVLTAKEEGEVTRPEQSSTAAQYAQDINFGIAETVLQSASLQGRVEASTALSDGTRLTVASRLLSVPHFSWSQLLPPLVALTLSALFIAFLILSRLTAPLRLLEGAAHRLASNINAPALPESGPFEVRSATAAFNTLQGRIKQLIADRSATAAAIAHDLGTPVTRMRLRVFDVDDEEVRSRLLSSLDQMKRMISGVLDFTRLDFETEKVEKVDLSSIVESIAQDLADLGAPVSVKSDRCITLSTKPVLLRRALTNLIENAVNYGTSASIDIADNRKTVEISIFDAGTGLSEKEWADATQPFRRLGQAPKETKGSGLGLTIARQIIENLGGTLTRTTDPQGRFGVLVTLSKSS